MLANSSRVLLRTATAMGGRTAVKALAARAASSLVVGVSFLCRVVAARMPMDTKLDTLLITHAFLFLSPYYSQRLV